MSRPNRLALTAYAIALVVVALDQASKWWLLHDFDLPRRLANGGFNEGLPVLGPFHLAVVWNSGVSFGFLNIGAEWTRWLLTIFALGVAAALAVWVRRVERTILAVALGLIIGGAIGNVIDRVRFGAVFDFLDFHRLWFPWVFNVADSGVSVGSVILIWDLFLAPPKAAAA